MMGRSGDVDSRQLGNGYQIQRGGIRSSILLHGGVSHCTHQSLVWILQRTERGPRKTQMQHNYKEMEILIVLVYSTKCKHVFYFIIYDTLVHKS